MAEAWIEERFAKRSEMEKNRLEAFSDGVLAIIITIMVLELKVPHGASIDALEPLLPVFLSYVLSFLYVGIYWNNHHHMFQTTKHVSGGILWANLHLLFWLSLIPFATSWVGEHPSEPIPTALYGVSLLIPALAWIVMQRVIIRNEGGSSSALARALGSDWKGKLSPALYLAGVAASFLHTLVADALYVLVALLWLIPDRRIERAL
jgi:uncharacterized membrane protein